MSRAKPKASAAAVGRTMTAADLCDELTVDVRTVDRWCARGCPHAGGGKGRPRLFNAAEVAAWMKAEGVTGETGRPLDLGGAGDPDGRLLAARVRKEEAMADLYEVLTKREKGELLSRAYVEADQVRLATLVRNKLLGLPAAIAPVLAGMAVPAIEQELEERLRDVLTELSRT